MPSDLCCSVNAAASARCARAKFAPSSERTRAPSLTYTPNGVIADVIVCTTQDADGVTDKH